MKRPVYRIKNVPSNIISPPLHSVHDANTLTVHTNIVVTPPSPLTLRIRLVTRWNITNWSLYNVKMSDLKSQLRFSEKNVKS